MLQYCKATENQVEEIVTLLCKAFEHYPILQFYTSHTKQQAFLTVINRMNVRAYMRRHICLVGMWEEQVVSVALLKKAHISSIHLVDYLLTGNLSALFSIEISKMLAFLKMLHTAQKAAMVEKQTWYLDTLGVSPQHQRKKLGSKMLHDCVIPYIQHYGGGNLALITNTEQNRRFYKHNGFTEVREIPLQQWEKPLFSWGYVRNIPPLIKK